MPALLIPNVPDDLHRRLMRDAATSGRSLDQHVLAILERGCAPVAPVRLPNPIAPLRPISAEEIAAALGDAPPLAPIQPVKTKRPFSHGWLLRAIREGRE